MTDKERIKRLKCALGILVNNLEGEGFDAFKPIGVELGNKMAQLARAAYFEEDDERLDEAMMIFTGPDQ